MPNFKLYKPKIHTARGVKKHSKTYWIENRVAGRLLRSDTGYATRSRAYHRAKEINVEWHQMVQSTGWYVTDSTSLPDLINEYPCGPESRRRIHLVLEPFEFLRHATTRRIRARVITIRDERNIAPTHANAYLGSVSKFFEWLVKDKRWTHNPCERISRDAVFLSPPNQAILISDLQRVLVSVSRPRAISYLIWFLTGAPRSEVSKWTWDEDFKPDSLEIAGYPLPADAVEVLLTKERVGDTIMKHTGWRGRPNASGMPSHPTVAKDFRHIRFKISTNSRLQHALKQGLVRALMNEGYPHCTATSIMRFLPENRERDRKAQAILSEKLVRYIPEDTRLIKKTCLLRVLEIETPDGKKIYFHGLHKRSLTWVRKQDVPDTGVLNFHCLPLNKRSTSSSTQDTPT